MNNFFSVSYTAWEELKGEPSFSNLAQLVPLILLVTMLMFIVFFIIVSRPKEDKIINKKRMSHPKIVFLAGLVYLLIKTLFS